MSNRVIGDAGEIKTLEKQLLVSIREVMDLSRIAEKYVNRMEEQCHDKSVNESKIIVKEVQKALLKGLNDSGEVVNKLKEYAEFLEKLSK